MEKRLTITDTTVIASFDILHIYLVFPRLRNLGLGIPTTEYFCEDTYDDYKAKGEKQTVETNKKVLQEIRQFQVGPIKEEGIELYNSWDDKRNTYLSS